METSVRSPIGATRPAAAVSPLYRVVEACGPGPLEGVRDRRGVEAKHPEVVGVGEFVEGEVGHPVALLGKIRMFVNSIARAMAGSRPLARSQPGSG